MTTKVAGFMLAAVLACSCGRPSPSGAPAEPAAPASDTAAAPDPAMAKRAGYDDKADPAKQLAAIVPTAQTSHRRILLVVGGEWCVWCHYLHDFLDKEADIRAVWDERFVTLHVNYSEENKNDAFLSQYPKIPGYPHIFVLDEHGRFLHSQGTEVLESGRGYSKDAVRKFLDDWGTPKRS